MNRLHYDEPTDEIITLAKRLIRTPSRATEDSPTRIISVVADWARSQQLTFNRLFSGKSKEVGGYFHYKSGIPGPSVCLDACLDTCGFGDKDKWTHEPTSAKVVNGWLFGRGSADSKMAAAIFCHLLRDASRHLLPITHGELFVLLDADEHTGAFNGLKSFLGKHKPDMVVIGYPGNKEIAIGARGFLRADISVFGKSVHSGSSSSKGINAAVKAAALAQYLSEEQLPPTTEAAFAIGAKLTITGINSGDCYSQVPDTAIIKVDIRLTPSCNEGVARQWLLLHIQKFDSENRYGGDASKAAFKESWPAYALDKTHKLVQALHLAASREMPHDVDLRVCGPSNIGNMLAGRNIPATCGFGVNCRGVHEVNEAVEVDTIAPTYRAHARMLMSVLGNEP